MSLCFIIFQELNCLQNNTDLIRSQDMLQALQALNQTIFQSATEHKKSYKHSAEQLTKLVLHYKSINPNTDIDIQGIFMQESEKKLKYKDNQQRDSLLIQSKTKDSVIKVVEGQITHENEERIIELFAIGFYNIAKISSRFKYLHAAMLFLQTDHFRLLKIKWWLQMLALASSRDAHYEAYREACNLISYILEKINELKLPKQQEMLAREVNQLVHRPKTSNMISASSLNQLQMSRKFETDCFFVSKTFHIADIMIMEPINPKSGLSLLLLYPPNSSPPSSLPSTQSQFFFYHLIYLSIACFTRATQRFYCRDSSDKDFHYKSIQIAGYLYSSKSTFMRFLRRTYKQHYLERLQHIQQVCEFGDRKVRVLEDGVEVEMGRMPWQNQEVELVQGNGEQNKISELKIESQQ